MLGRVIGLYLSSLGWMGPWDLLVKELGETVAHVILWVRAFNFQCKSFQSFLSPLGRETRDIRDGSCPISLGSRGPLSPWTPEMDM